MLDDDALTWITDQDLRVTAVSRRFRELAGPAVTRSGSAIAEVFASEDQFQTAVDAHQWARQGGLVEFGLRWRGGVYRVHVQPLQSTRGMILGVLGSARKVEANETPGPCDLGNWRVDLETGKTTWSSALCALLGIERPPANGSIREFDHPQDVQAVREALSAAESRVTGYRCEHRIVRADGQIRFVREEARLRFDAAGNAVALEGSILDVTDHGIAESLEPSSHALLQAQVSDSIQRAQRNGTLCAVLFLCIDRLKEVGDKLGRAAADELLAAVRVRLRRELRKNDTVSRIGDDEVAIVLEDLATNHEAHKGARAVLDSFSRPFDVRNTSVTVSASIGVGIFPFTAATAPELCLAAHAAMEMVSHAGGGAFEVARPYTPTRDAGKVRAACVVGAST